MLRRILVGAAAPVLAIVMAMLITVVILLLAGNSVSGFMSTIFSVPAPRNVVNIINNSSVLYLSALAAAIGFRMNLFNIGVEGQYRVAVFAAAAFAGQGWLPGPLNVVVAIVIAILSGAAWAAIAGLLKVTRGVSEVISTIMLNAIAVSLTAYLLRKWGGIVGNSIQTKQLPKDSWVPGHPADPGRPQRGARPRRRRGARRRRVRRAAEPLALRLRAARDGCLGDRRGGQRDRRTPDGGDLDDHLRRHRRAGRAAAAVR